MANPVKPKFKIRWDVTSNVMSAFVGAAALIFSTYQYLRGSRLEAKINRPYITVSSWKISYDTLPAFGIQPICLLRNYGQRPANDVAITSNSFSEYKGSTFRVLDKSEFEITNTMVNGVDFDFGTYIVKPVDEKLNYIIKLRLEYVDAISNIKYYDSLYYRWQFEKSEIFKLPQIKVLEKQNVDRLESFLNQ